jgi:hypothetical protein
MSSEVPYAIANEKRQVVELAVVVVARAPVGRSRHVDYLPMTAAPPHAGRDQVGRERHASTVGSAVPAERNAH